MALRLVLIRLVAGFLSAHGAQLAIQAIRS
jgi:hypothetical protein